MQTQTHEHDKFEHAKSNAACWLASIEEMLAKLNGSSDLGPDREDAEQTIHESVLSVQVRDGWRAPGSLPEDSRNDEYEILLTTGGPALRIWGKLSHYAEPESAELQMQDWFLPWTRYPAPEDTLLEFVRCFYLGD